MKGGPDSEVLPTSRHSEVSPGPGTSPSPEVARVTCAKDREKTALQDWGLRRIRRTSGPVFVPRATSPTFSKGARSPALDASPEAPAGGRAAPRILQIKAASCREQRRASARPRVPGEPSSGLRMKDS